MQCGAGAGFPEKWGRLTDRQTVGGEGHARGLTEIAQKKKERRKTLHEAPRECTKYKPHHDAQCEVSLLP